MSSSKTQEPLPNLVKLLTAFCSLRYRNTVSVIELVTLPRVPGSVIDVSWLTTHEAGDKFAELICADPQWLDEEFSALTAANFTAPPAWPSQPAPPTFPPGGRFPGIPPGQSACRGRTGMAPVRVRPRWRGPRHQRSPPP